MTPNAPAPIAPPGRDQLAARQREVWILVPVAMALIAALAIATLAAWRVAQRDLEDSRQREATRSAEVIASRIGPGAPSDLALRHLGALVRGVAVITRDGQVVASTAPPEGALLPTSRADGGRATDVSEPEGVVLGWAPAAGERWVRVELDATLLRSQRRTLAVLGPLMFVVVLAASSLVLVFLRRFLQPWEQLLRRASEAAAQNQGEWITAAVDGALARHRGELDPDASRAVAASVETGLLVLGPTGELTATNPAAAELLGIDEPRLGQAWTEVLAGLPDLVAVLAAQLPAEDASELRDIVLPSGATLGISVHRLGRGGGGALVLLSDRTRASRELTETRLATALAELGELAAGVAHELRNGLAALSGRLDLLDRQREWRHLAPARDEVRVLERVVADFLAFARPGTARREDLDLGELAATLASERVVVTSSPGALVVRGDRVLLERAIGNLIENALQAHPPDSGPVEVLVASGDGFVTLEVVDRGPGINPAIRARLFRPFATGRPDGVGLGLAIARRIVDLHGGQLELLDRTGGGTRAVLRLPTADGNNVTEGNALEAARSSDA